MKLHRIVFLAGIGAVVPLWSSGCTSEPTSAEAAEAKLVEPKSAVPVTVAPVAVQPSARLVNFVGTLYGNEEVTISSQVEGQIEKLNVDMGDRVEAGAILAQVDDAQWRARLRESEAMLAKAQADEARSRQLIDTNIISKQEYESVQTHAEVARAQRDTLSLNIHHAKVAAPIRAAVVKRFVSAGEYVRAGTQLFTLVAEDPLKLRGDVPERFAHELQIGQPVQVRVDAFPDQVFEGRLARISPASNPQNRSLGVEVQIANKERRLKPGFFANAAVVTRADDRALMIPQEALISFAGVSKVFVIKDGVAQERLVQTGNRGSDGMIEVTDGVAADESVATSGLAKLESGALVTVKAPDATPARQP